MMLTQGEEDNRVEVVHTEEMLNPCHQYLYQVLTDRALRPGCVLPPPAQHITNMLQLPEEILAAMAPHVIRLKEVFTTQEVIKKKAKRTAEDLLGKERGGEEEEEEGAKRARPES